MGARIGIDVGGTFTDFILTRDDAPPLLHKVLSTPADPSIAVVTGLAELAAMVVATVNAVLLVFVVDDLWLAHSFAWLYPLPAGYAELGAKALSGTVFPIKLIVGIVVTTVTWRTRPPLCWRLPRTRRTSSTEPVIAEPGGPPLAVHPRRWRHAPAHHREQNLQSPLQMR